VPFRPPAVSEAYPAHWRSYPTTDRGGRKPRSRRSQSTAPQLFVDSREAVLDLREVNGSMDRLCAHVDTRIRTVSRIDQTVW